MRKLFMVGIFVVLVVFLQGCSSSETIEQASEAEDQTSAVDGASEIPGELAMEQVALHASADDCWMVIDGKVYDVSDYVNIHPGGAEEVTRGCGKEATELFETQGGGDDGHPRSAQAMLEDYYIGDLK